MFTFLIIWFEVFIAVSIALYRIHFLANSLFALGKPNLFLWRVGYG